MGTKKTKVTADLIEAFRADGASARMKTWHFRLPNGATIKYVATVADGKWTEVGSYVGVGMPPVEFAKLEVVRIGDTDWPAAGFVTAKP